MRQTTMAEPTEMPTDLRRAIERRDYWTKVAAVDPAARPRKESWSNIVDAMLVERMMKGKQR